MNEIRIQFRYDDPTEGNYALALTAALKFRREYQDRTRGGYNSVIYTAGSVQMGVYWTKAGRIVVDCWRSSGERS